MPLTNELRAIAEREGTRMGKLQQAQALYAFHDLYAQKKIALSDAWEFWAEMDKARKAALG